MNWGQLAITVVTVVSILGVLTLVLNMQYGHAGMINFGVVAYFAVGAYAYVLVTQAPPSEASLDQYVIGLGLPPWAGLIGAALAGLVFAAITGWPTLRLRGEYLALTTFAFAEVFHSFIVNEQRFANGTRGLVGVPRPYRETLDFVDYDIVLAIGALVFLIVVYVIFERIVKSPYGRALEALRDDELALITSGKRSRRFRMEIFLFTAPFAGMAGAFYVWYTTLVIPDLFTAEVTFIVWIALVLGGEGSNRGALIGITLVTLFEELVRAIPFSTIRAAQVAAELEVAALGLLLIIFLRWQPFAAWTKAPKRVARS
ncbi:MAG TPA: branched-chain amino acid ABC transporter permease [Acidimicrobiia bacterium]|nr:branched-chain amino acid ABC transporter permease [Acidimicrobiia bacterium]